MKPICRILAAGVLLVAVLAGCQQPVKDQTVVCGELTFTLPGDYVNQINEPFAQDLDFLYGHGGEAVLAFKQDRAVLEEVFPELSAETFAEMFIEKAELNTVVEISQEVVTFTYTADANGTAVTYLSGVYRTAKNFWIVQFYCPSEDFADRQADFLGYLAAIAY